MKDFHLLLPENKIQSAYEIAERELGTIKKDLNTNRKRIIVTGSDQYKIAAVSAWLIANNHQVILLPEKISLKSPDDNPFNAEIIIDLSLNKTQIINLKLKNRKISSDSWDLAYFTSGSTGKPKIIGVRKDQLQITVDWYKSIYQVSSNSLIASSLPSTYNFTLVAGILLSSSVGGTFYFDSDPNYILRTISHQSEKIDRCTILANPVTLEIMANNAQPLGYNILIDSGGAPLSTTAIRWFRSHVGDLREGYGLTETCSLTHFDREGTEASVGTVGHGMIDVETIIQHENNKPFVHIYTPNIGIILNWDGSDTNKYSKKIFTGDVGTLDKEGRLRLLGRQDDQQINGYWPRDTLDKIGEVLGPRCAMVRHLVNNKVLIRLWKQVNEKLAINLRLLVAEYLQIRYDDIHIESIGTQTLHSKKIPRN